VPIFSRMLKRHESVEEMVKLSFTLIITVALIVAFGSYFYSRPLMAALYDSHIDQSAAVFRLLMGGFVAVSTSYIFGTLLTANGNLKALNIISLSGLAINLVMNFWLIPRFLAVGSAYASLTTQFFTATAQLLIVQKIFRFRINYRYLFTLAIFTIGVILFNYLSLQIRLPLSGLPEKILWLPNFLIAILLSVILAFALRLLNLRGIVNIIRSDQP
jgi:O-antigen/teichoic acid export membrane protein